MVSTNKFALIGKTLKHSYSKVIHQSLSDCEYSLVELMPDGLQTFVESDIKGFNVTIPYKTDVIKYLDEVDDRATKIGAVNTVICRDGKKKGYNTDFDGMVYMLKSAGINVNGKVVMILGSGGTSKTATVVAKTLGAKSVLIVSRNGEINYQNCYQNQETQVIINTTPVGMFPNNYDCPINLEKFHALEGVADVVYNPNKTKLCYQAEKMGIKNVNGLKMLVAQAKYAHELFTGTSISDDVIEKIYNKLVSEKQNVVLIGMPGSGKSSIGRLVAEKLGREFIDTDSEIIKKVGTDIPTIFKEKGEAFFREVEKQVLREVGALTGKVIATGGGVIKNEENHFPLSSNGKIFFIKRDVEKLVTAGRPLSKDLATVKELYEQRKDLYCAFADIEIDNNGDIDSAVKEIIKL